MHRSEFIKNIYHCTISIFNPIYKNDVTLGERMISIHSHNTKRQRKKREKKRACTCIYIGRFCVAFCSNSFFFVGMWPIINSLYACECVSPGTSICIASPSLRNDPHHSQTTDLDHVSWSNVQKKKEKNSTKGNGRVSKDLYCYRFGFRRKCNK